MVSVWPKACANSRPSNNIQSWKSSSIGFSSLTTIFCPLLKLSLIQVFPAQLVKVNGVFVQVLAT
jgi:hypothetical protein